MVGPVFVERRRTPDSLWFDHSLVGDFPGRIALGSIAQTVASLDDVVDGEVAEWSNAPHSKCGMLARASGVRIPPSPPYM